MKHGRSHQFLFFSSLLVVSTLATSTTSRGSGRRRDNDAWEVGEVEVTEEVLSLLVDGDLGNIKLGVFGDNVVFSLTLLFLQLERNATDRAPSRM